ncbi:MAG: N-acetylmuramoyl-L-alanine amidase [Gemmatimonadaceae bacterium]
MIAAALLALLQFSAPPGVLTVRVAERETAIPLVETNAGPAVRADLVAGALGGRVREESPGHYGLSLPGVEFEVAEQVPFVRAGDEVVPLAASPFVDEGKLYVPLQLIAEALPRLGTGVFYDSGRTELRTFDAAGQVAVASSPVLRVAARPAAGSGAASVGPTPAANGAPTATRLDASRPRGRRRLVVVDAGHGGPDNGMSGPLGGPFRIYEKNVTLAVAQRLAAALRQRGVDVLMTRTRDTLIALDDRGRLANESRGDLFISVHVNAANMAWKDPGAARGYETYFLAEAKTEDARRVERMENEAVRFETRVATSRGDPLSFIMNDMAQNEHLRESSDLAETIQGRLGAMHPGPNRGVKQANFAVLRTSFMPAVLVEIGFGTNPSEAAFLNDPARQRAVADAIAGAAVEYLTHYERRVGGAAR